MQRGLALCEVGVSTAAGAAAAAAVPSAGAAASPGSPARTPSWELRLVSVLLQSGVCSTIRQNKAGRTKLQQPGLRATTPAKLGCGDASPSVTAASACACCAGAGSSLTVGNVTLRRARSILCLYSAGRSSQYFSSAVSPGTMQTSARAAACNRASNGAPRCFLLPLFWADQNNEYLFFVVYHLLIPFLGLHSP